MTNDNKIHGIGFAVFICVAIGAAVGLIGGTFVAVLLTDFTDRTARHAVRQEAVDAGVAVWEADQKTGETNFRWLSAAEWKEPDDNAPDA